VSTIIQIIETAPITVNVDEPTQVTVLVSRDQGPVGPGNSLSVGTVTSLNPDQVPDVTITGGSPSQTIDFDLPRASVVTVGATNVVDPDVNPDVSTTVTDGDVELDFDLPRAPVVTVGTTTPVNPDVSPNVTSTTTDGDLELDFDLPRAPAFQIGSVTTLPPLSDATVVDVGTDGDIVLDFELPQGIPGDLQEALANTLYVRLDGTVPMTGALTLSGDPTADLTAATKRYVDEVAQGLHAAPSARAATTANLDATYDNGVLGVGATLTASSDGFWEGVDGITLTNGYTWSLFQGVLVKDQTNPAHNGRYFISDLGNDGTTGDAAPWVLTRCTFCDTSEEIPGTFVFVEDGVTLKATGWVAIVNDPETFTVGTDAILFTQFSGAGTFIAGTGIDITGNTISVEADALLPLQTGNNGRFLTTDGTTTSWADVDALPDQSGNAGKYLQTDGTTASWEVLDLDSKADKLLSTNAQTASYTLVLSDADKMVEMNVASANDLTVPLDSSVAYPVGTQINILQTGAGQTTIVATGGVTIDGTPGLKLRTQWSSATLIKRATDTWVAIGDLVA
jgi:hypothetical protein